MVMNTITKKLLKDGMGFRTAKLYVPALFFAGDGLLLEGCVEEMKGKAVMEVEVKANRSINSQKTRLLKQDCTIYMLSYNCIAMIF